MTALLADADEAVRLVPADARAAARLAASVLSAGVDAEARSTAERALGLAAIEFGDAASAVSHLRRAVSLAVDGGLVRREGEARMSLSWALTQAGTIGEALVEADRAVLALDGSARARMEMQRALILQRLGRFAEALEGYRRPLAAFRRAGDTLWEARLLCNRGVLQVHRGAFGAASADLSRAVALHEADARPLAATQVRHNLGWVAARRGDVPGALAVFDRVEAEYRVHDVPLALLFMDRCDVLLSARLAGEARANANAAVAELESAGMGSDLAEAHLLAAQAELLCGDSPAARTHALAADAAFVAQRRPAWSALARAAAAQAAWMEVSDTSAGGATTAAGDASAGGATTAAGDASAGGATTAAGDASAGGATTTAGGDRARITRLEGALAEARRALRSLDAAGWGVEALDARLIAGRAALELGRPRLGRRQLELAAAARERGPVLQRTRAWHAQALLRLSHGDRRGASASVAAGLRALEAHRITLGATELRAHASGHGEELATLGLQLALRSGDARRVLAAAERRRAASLLLRPTRPPDDKELADELAELRRVTAALDEALRDGRPDPVLTRRQAALERSVRRRALRTQGNNVDPTHINGVRPSLETLQKRTLVEFFALEGRLHAVTIVANKATLHPLGAEADVDKEVASLRFSLRSLATARPGSRAADAMAEICATVAKRLEALLITPLALGRDDAPLVLVPTGALHALPWSLLPALAQRPISVSPSLKLWERANAATPTGNGTVLVAGPRLPAATAEIELLEQRHPRARTITGEQATVAAVAHALDGADAAHLAAHGHFRDDNPSFCSLELADGALTVYDLERLNQTPRRLVLSSCESGLSTVHAGDELMGFTAALFGLGTATVIAAVVPVPDEATKGLMLALDEALHQGVEPAQALVNARAQMSGDEDRRTVARAAFVCFGAG